MEKAKNVKVFSIFGVMLSASQRYVAPPAKLSFYASVMRFAQFRAARRGRFLPISALVPRRRSML